MVERTAQTEAGLSYSAAAAMGAEHGFGSEPQLTRKPRVKVYSGCFHAVLPGFKSLFCHILAMELWGSHLTLICQVGTMILVVVSIRWVHKCKGYMFSADRTILFESLVSDLLLLWISANFFTSLSLSFLIYGDDTFWLYAVAYLLIFDTQSRLFVKLPSSIWQNLFQ